MNQPEQPNQHPTALDSDEKQVGVLYGKAILGAAGDQADAIVEELQAVVAECLDQHPGLEQVLGSVRISQEEKEALIDRVFGGRVSGTLLNFLKVLCRRNRIGYLRSIQRTAQRLRDEQLGRIEALVTSAKPLSDDQRSAISAKLQETLGNEILLLEKVDESLLGGIVIRIGDKVYDGSVIGKMESIRASVIKSVEKAIRDKYDSLVSS